MRFVYSLSIYGYQFLIFIVSQFNKKAQLWRNGRRNWQQQLKDNIDNSKPLIWFHCASLGEFEQGKPVLEELKSNFPNHFILLTFFSPSGFEVKRNEPLANFVCYLPIDTPINAKRFIAITQPKIGILVKYEFWFNILFEAKQAETKLFLISGIFRKNQLFFKPFGTWFLRQLHLFEGLLVQNEESKKILIDAGIDKTKVALTGDTRFDRVSNLINEKIDYPELSHWIGKRNVFVAGSTWPSDLQMLKMVWQEMKNQNWVFIIAPHDINEQTSHQTQLIFQAINYDELLAKPTAENPVLVLNRIGMLAQLYSFAKIAYIGGGFDKGIHNTLEAAVFGNAIFFGPRFQKFDEAKGLIKTGGAISIQTSDELLAIIKQKEIWIAMGEKAARYVANNVGAVNKTCHKIFPYLAPA